jgi:hypothetical protein
LLKILVKNSDWSGVGKVASLDQSTFIRKIKTQDIGKTAGDHKRDSHAR